VAWRAMRWSEGRAEPLLGDGERGAWSWAGAARPERGVGVFDLRERA
jgi:hypothetical protein